MRFMDTITIRWEFRIPEPNDDCHISIWYALPGADFIHAQTYHVFHEDNINAALSILECAYPGKTVEFARSRGVIFVHKIL